MASLDPKQAYSAKVRGVNVVVSLEDTNVRATKHSKDRQHRHRQKISNQAIVQAVELAMGKIIQDYANGELANNEKFVIRMKGKGKTPALNVVALLNMRKGTDEIRVVTVMRKDDFKNDDFSGVNGQQKIYAVNL